MLWNKYGSPRVIVLSESTFVNHSNASRPTDVAKALLDKTTPGDGDVTKVSIPWDPTSFLSLSVLVLHVFKCQCQ